ncbi:hypothetical protein TTHERM_001026419 (macronuclear) [Tetrahymena thermophila SB210]|uniref:Uncharacterized protein n=1 Tax=Tetrahymena thermophila (strain SB210) TaxID=312017 RepID=W7X9G1_TETTS|nr:hypothetical protein TTHERM_001026419 [Tetrahymena thermophila SB210]EWS76045.1 hypothetical protein TTHERM_001026419 [Tetrahymena thermophila SB210]|eukprot:XP_012651429.1 hypothetical protein TTHERM_001026419 [Tetrahymena thermophila SB210]
MYNKNQIILIDQNISNYFNHQKFNQKQKKKKHILNKVKNSKISFNNNIKPKSTYIYNPGIEIPLAGYNIRIFIEFFQGGGIGFEPPLILLMLRPSDSPTRAALPFLNQFKR